MDNLDTADLTDMQFLLVGASVSHPTILTSRQMRTAYALERKGWGTVEAGGWGETIFRLNQAGADALYLDSELIGRMKMDNDTSLGERESGLDTLLEQGRAALRIRNAAPELLAACQAVAASSMRNEAYDLCVAAIAKATQP